ncbi:unnamed protein product, partial [marine sediment metagenome]
EVESLEVDVEALRQRNFRLASEVEALEIDVEEVKQKNAGLNNEIEELQEQLENIEQGEGETDEYEEGIAEIESMMEEVIGQEFYERYEESEYALENLKNMTAFFINEYTALIE